MSTRKTEHFGLHAWEAGDSFLRSEFNENFAALDEAVQIVTGAYVGDGAAERSFELGFRPRAVMMMDSSGTFWNTVGTFGSVTVDGVDTGALFISDSGFTIRNSGSYKTNLASSKHHYLALR